MIRPPFIDATWKLPEGHESVGAYVHQNEAVQAAQEMAFGEDGRFYIMDKRGAWEIIRYSARANQPE